LPPVVIAASGMPCASTIRWCLLPAVPRSTEGRTGGRPALHRADVAGVDGCAGEVQQVCGPQLGKQQLVQALPDLGSFQSRSRRQQVIPEPKPSSWGRNSQRIPVSSTNRIPHSTLRLSRRLLRRTADTVAQGTDSAQRSRCAAQRADFGTHLAQTAIDGGWWPDTAGQDKISP
jgi:hypothetical protein